MSRRSARKDRDAMKRQIDELASSVDQIKSGLEALEKLVDAATASFAGSVREVTRESRALVDDAIEMALTREVGRRINEVEALIASTSAELRARSAGLGTKTAGLQLPDGFYSALEQEFPGDVDAIALRQARYAQRVVDSPPHGKFLDLGCGRGEFLTILRNHDVPAVGVDFDPWSAEQLRAAGHEAVVADALDYLRTLPDASIRGASMLQVIEHIDIARLVAILTELRRVVVRNGVVIAETPNGANIKVAASTFWIDPSHIHPMLPEFVAFLFKFAGFEVEATTTSIPTAYPWELDQRDATAADPEIRDAVVGLQRLVVGHQDVTVIATVPNA